MLFLEPLRTANVKHSWQKPDLRMSGVNSEDISDVTSTVTQYSRLAKATKTKEMTEFKRTSNDCRFTYMLDFILKPGRKLEYYDNASLPKFEGNSSIAQSVDVHPNPWPIRGFIS